MVRSKCDNLLTFSTNFDVDRKLYTGMSYLTIISAHQIVKQGLLEK